MVMMENTINYKQRSESYAYSENAKSRVILMLGDGHYLCYRVEICTRNQVGGYFILVLNKQ